MVVNATEKPQADLNAVPAHAVQARSGDEVNDEIIKQLFSVTIELHAALGLVKSRQAAHRIDHAIGELDDVIKALLNATLDARLQRHDR
jgi:hypothetical protein